jgi:flagellar biosynthesis GTPase FlhF
VRRAVVPPARWSADELARRALLEQGVAVALNLRRHGTLIAWAKGRGLFVRVDRATPWGNPFVIGRDGDRAIVIARYRDQQLQASREQIDGLKESLQAAVNAARDLDRLRVEVTRLSHERDRLQATEERRRVEEERQFASAKVEMAAALAEQREELQRLLAQDEGRWRSRVAEYKRLSDELNAPHLPAEEQEQIRVRLEQLRLEIPEAAANIEKLEDLLQRTVTALRFRETAQ